VRLLEKGQLKPHIDLEASWDQIAEVAQKLTDRQIVGKAVLHLG
jgi:NADPH:quinone reductase